MSAQPVRQVDVGRCKSLARLRWKGAENPGADRGPGWAPGTGESRRVVIARLHAQGVPVTLQEAKVRGRIVPVGQTFLSAAGAPRGKERSPEAEPLSSSIAPPRLELLSADDHPTKINRARMSMANGMWVRRGGNAKPLFRGSKPARDCLRNPKSAAGRARRSPHVRPGRAGPHGR